jgi:cytochrome c peroxidase
MDPTVSRLGRNSCASCHDPERAFGDPRPTSPDDAGPTRRHSQTLLDLTGEGFHWDGEFKTVRQLLVARVAPAEMANAQAVKLFAERLATARKAGEASATDRLPTPVPGTPVEPPPSSYGFVPPSAAPITPSAERLAEDGRYAAAFRAAFGTATPSTERILDAMDAYCASLRSTTNGFDRFIAGDDAALTDSAKRGLALFEGRAGCAQCHSTKPVGGRAAFTDGKFHDTGVAYHSDPLWRVGMDGPAPRDAGRGGITMRTGEFAKFKTPTLRDVALRAPYMHDASFATLTDVVKYYSGGGTRNPNLDPAIRRTDLSDTEVADVVAFLGSLTGTSRAGLGFPLRRAAPLRVRVVDLHGKPMPAFTVKVAAFGDRLTGAETVAAPAAVLTDDKGEALIERPLATHVVLTNTAYELGLSRPIPDFCETQTLIATPRETVSLRIRRGEGGPSLPSEIGVVPGERGPSMGSCGPTPVMTLRRIRVIGSDEALYAGAAPADRSALRCTLVFDSGTTAVVADLDLTGGASETILLGRPAHRAASAPRPNPSGAPRPTPGEDTDHGTDKDRGAREDD